MDDHEEPTALAAAAIEIIVSCTSEEKAYILGWLSADGIIQEMLS